MGDSSPAYAESFRRATAWGAGDSCTGLSTVHMERTGSQFKVEQNVAGSRGGANRAELNFVDAPAQQPLSLPPLSSRTRLFVSFTSLPLQPRD